MTTHIVRGIGIDVKFITLAMRITAAILLIFSLHVTAKSVSQTITLSGKNIPLTKVFSEIEKQSGYLIVYSEELVSNAKPVSVEVKDYPLLDFMNETFGEQGLGYVIENKTIFLKKSVAAINSNPNKKDPPIDVKGRVVDENGEPVEGVTVSVRGSNKAITTNANGEFELSGIYENAVLVISSVSIEPMEIAVAKNPGLKTGDGLIITAKTEITTLNEVVINKGYYSEKQRLSTGNVVKVTSKDIEKSPVTNPLLALPGRVPGMQITQANGLPGTGVTVQIRGRNSIFNGNDPLYIVDGVPYLSQMLPGLTSIAGNSGANNGYSTGSPLSYINPGDIESIEVLKDADATAIYGTRGANGVVLITTKKGKVGPTRVDVNVQQGWGKVTRFIPWMNTRQYLDMRYEAYKNDGVDITTLTPDASNYDLTVWDTTRYTDWNKELIGGTANFFNVQVSLYGGSNNVQYRLGYNFNKQTTTFPGSFGDPKGSLSFNINSNSNNKKLKVQLSGNYQIDHNSLPGYDLSEFTDLAPNAPALYNPDGSLNWESDPVTGYPTWDNPLAIQNRKYKRRVNNLVTNAVFSYELLSGLDLRISTGYTNMQSDEIRTDPASAIAPAYLPFVNRKSQFGTSQNDSWIVEPQIGYITQLVGGKLSVLVGATIQQNVSKGQSLTARGFNSDLVMEDAKAAQSVEFDNTIDAVYKYNAVFGRFNYNYRDKYLINLTARRDGTSRFGPDKQFANFGALGLGWIFSKENFISKNLPFLSFGKIRASYGTTGSDQVGDYRYLNLYDYVNFNIPYQNSLSLVLNGLFNPDLAWEETKKLETALELGFLQDKVLLSASYYRNRSSNQLTTYQLPSNTGASGIPSNIDATVQNTGWEFTATTSNIRHKAFRWTSSINFSVPQTKLVSVSPRAITVDQRRVGHPLNSVFMYSFAGVDPATGQYQFYDGKGGLTFQPDTAYDAITKRRYTEQVKNVGVRYYGGFQNSFSWKDLQLDILLQYEKRLGQSNQRGSYPGGDIINQPVTVLDRWQKPGDNAFVQRYNQDYNIYNSINFLQSSDAVWTDASFIRCKNVSFSWHLPGNLRKKLHLQNARIYTQAQNLFTIVTYKGSDPETRSLISLPPLRMLTVGLQLTF